MPIDTVVVLDNMVSVCGALFLGNLTLVRRLTLRSFRGSRHHDPPTSTQTVSDALHLVFRCTFTWKRVDFLLVFVTCTAWTGPLPRCVKSASREGRPG